MKKESYDATEHKHFVVKVVDFSDNEFDYDVFGNDSLKSEAQVYQSCISYPHHGIIMVRHADGIVLFESIHHIEIFVRNEPDIEKTIHINGIAPTS